MARLGDLPPGQFETEEHFRFGWGSLAFRFPTNPDVVEIAVRGDVGTPLVVRDELAKLPRVDLVADLHCVTTWSKRGLHWSGFRFSDFYRLIVEPSAVPLPGATLVVLRSQDGYQESLPLEDLLAPDVLLADRLDGAPLGIAHGAPLRLVAPAHYGYKNVKHLCAIELWRDARAYRFPGPGFMDHPRARVALEERAHGVPNWIVRRTYPALIPLIRQLFRFALARHEKRAARTSRGSGVSDAADRRAPPRASAPATARTARASSRRRRPASDRPPGW
jgi:DMSO/TMAO reductase YedYZ molybdopterin-dependent catalytic subunit